MELKQTIPTQMTCYKSEKHKQTLIILTHKFTQENLHRNSVNWMIHNLVKSGNEKYRMNYTETTESTGGNYWQLHLNH